MKVTIKHAYTGMTATMNVPKKYLVGAVTALDGSRSAIVPRKIGVEAANLLGCAFDYVKGAIDMDGCRNVALDVWPR